ncbi:MAG TPA: ATP-binding protein, partial [Aggregatilineales bacterium]|nr:ATP-binding protein [Aggregatilineales bacterium]
VCGRVARQGKPELVVHVGSDPDFIGAIDGVVSEICVPLFDDDEVVGVLNVESTGDVILTEADARLMTALSIHIGTALRRARFYTELQESEARNRALLDAIPDMIIRHDRTGNYLDIRPSANFEPLFPLEECIGSNVNTILPPPYARMRLKYIEKALESGEVQLFDYPIEVRGVQYEHEARVVPADNDEVLVFIRDVTERKAAEKHALELAVERERMRLLGQFISDVSHDFRTPLSTISTGLYLLGKTPDAHKQQERLAMIQQQVNNLSQMIDSMLTLVRLESNPRFDFKPLNFNQIVRDVAASMNSAIARKELNLVFDLAPDLPKVLADRSDWGKLLMELMKNAIQYTSPQDTVTIKTCQEDDFIVFELQDTGCGIEESETALIFERFYRTDKARRAETGGAGLGLAIAKKIAEVHGGWIEVKSKPGEGSTFRVKLPHRNLPEEGG